MNKAKYKIFCSEIFCLFSLFIIFCLPNSLFAADIEIKQLWSFPAQIQAGAVPGDNRQPENSMIDFAPVVDETGGFVFIADRKTLYKLKIEDGTVLKKMNLSAPLSAAPILGEARIYISDINKNLICFDNDLSPKPLWTATLSAENIISLQMTDKGIACSFKDGSISLSDKMTGSLIWKIKIGEGIQFSPTIDMKQEKAFVFGSQGGMYLIRLNSGTASFITSLPAVPLSPPIYADEKIYTSLENGRLVALKEKTGIVDWEVSVINDVVASAVVYEDMVCFNALNNQLFCYDKDSGTLDGRFSGKSRFYQPPVISDDMIFSFGFNNGILAADLEKCKTIGWAENKLKPSAPIVAVPTKKILLLIDNHERLTALDFNLVYEAQHKEK